MPRPKCNSCYYLGQQTVDDDPTVDVCRRNSPVPTDESLKAQWPIVNRDDDWCGDHHPIGEDGPA